MLEQLKRLSKPVAVLNDLHLKADKTETVLISTSRRPLSITCTVITLLCEQLAQIRTTKHPYLSLLNDLRPNEDVLETVEKAGELSRGVLRSKMM